MPGYRAGAGSGMFGSHTTPPNRPMVDVGGAIDSLTNGTSSLIRQWYEMKRIKQQDQERRDAIAYQRSRDTIEDQRHTEEQTQKRADSERDFGLKEETARHNFITAGGIPAHKNFDAQTPAAPVPEFAAPSTGAIGLAMTKNTAIARPSTAAAAAPNRVTQVDESYDPERSGSYQRAIDTQALRNAGMVTRDEANQEARARTSAEHDARVASMRTSAQESAKALTRLRSTLSKAGGGGITKAMSGNQLEKGRVAAAEDLIDKAGGSYDSAVSMLSGTEQGRMLREQGVTEYHLSQAHSAYVNRGSNQATKFQTGVFGVPGDSAVKIVKGTRQQIGNPAPAPVTGTPVTGGMASARIIAPGKKAPTTPAPAAKTPPAADDFSDDEIRAAVKVGKTKPDDVRAYVTDQRNKKKKGGE